MQRGNTDDQARDVTARAEARGVESDVILCRDAMFRIARQAPRTLAELGEIPAEHHEIRLLRFHVSFEALPVSLFLQ